MEAAAAHFYGGVPVAGGVVGLGGEVKVVESVGAVGYFLGVETALGGIQFQGGGVPFRERLALIGQNHGEVHGVAGTPYAALAVDIGLEALVQHLAAYVKAAQGALVAANYPQVGNAAAGLAHHGKGLAGDGELGQTVAVGLALGDELQLVIVHFQAGARHGLGGEEVGGGQPQGATLGVFGHQAQVAGHELHGGETVAVHVVRRLGGVVGLFPIILAPVVIVFPIVRAGGVPDGLVGAARGAVYHLAHAARLLAAIEALVQAEAQPDAVQRAGLLLQEAAQVQTVLVPLVQVLGGVQGDVGLIHQAAASAQAGTTSELVFLQEHEHVLLVDLHNAHLYGAQVHGLEGEDERLFVGQNLSLEGNLDGGFLFLELEGAGESLAQGVALGIFQALVQREGEVLFPALEMDSYGAVFYLHIAAQGALELHQAFLGGVHGAAAQFYVNVVFFLLGAHYAELLSVVRLLGEHGGLGRALPHRQAEVKALQFLGGGSHFA